jgi:hypothetical protein
MILQLPSAPCVWLALRFVIWLRKIWGFHGSDYEECRLLGYKNPVRTSQETHYVSTTESSQLMLYKTWGFRGGDYEECCSSGMLRHVALVRTDVPEKLSASMIRVTRIGELGTALAVTSNRCTALHPRRRYSSCHLTDLQFWFSSWVDWVWASCVLICTRFWSEIIGGIHCSCRMTEWCSY